MSVCNCTTGFDLVPDDVLALVLAWLPGRLRSGVARCVARRWRAIAVHGNGVRVFGLKRDGWEVPPWVHPGTTRAVFTRPAGGDDGRTVEALAKSAPQIQRIDFVFECVGGPWSELGCFVVVNWPRAFVVVCPNPPDDHGKRKGSSELAPFWANMAEGYRIPVVAPRRMLHVAEECRDVACFLRSLPADRVADLIARLDVLDALPADFPGLDRVLKLRVPDDEASSGVAGERLLRTVQNRCRNVVRVSACLSSDVGADFCARACAALPRLRSMRVVVSEAAALMALAACRPSPRTLVLDLFVVRGAAGARCSGAIGQLARRFRLRSIEGAGVAMLEGDWAELAQPRNPTAGSLRYLAYRGAPPPSGLRELLLKANGTSLRLVNNGGL